MVQPMDFGPCAFWKTRKNARFDRALAPIAPPVRVQTRRHSVRGRRHVEAGLLAGAALMALTALGVVSHGRSGSGFPAASTMSLSSPVRVPITVRHGDSLWSLAKRYGDPNVYILDRVDTLARANGFSSSATLQPGQRIIVPVGNPVELAKVQQFVAKN